MSINTIAYQVKGYHYTNIPKDMPVKSYGNQYGNWFEWVDGSRSWYNKESHGIPIDGYEPDGLLYISIGVKK